MSVKHKVVYELRDKEQDVTYEEYQMYQMAANYVRLITEIDGYSVFRWPMGFVMIAKDEGASVASWIKGDMSTLSVSDVNEWNRFRDVCYVNNYKLEM